MEQVVVVRAYIELNGKILILKRSKTENLHSEQFELPGGKLEIGEKLEEALARELKEEIGDSLGGYSLFHAYSYTMDKYHAIVLTYYVKTDSEFKPILSKEHQEYSWQRLETLENNNITEELKELMEYITDNKDEKNTTLNTEVNLYTDGGSRGNPGPSALGYVIFDMEDNVVKKGSSYLGITTNNQAEYQAVKAGLEACSKLGASKINVYLDSQLVANQMNGIYKVKNRDLWPIHESIKKLAESFKGGVTFMYVPRSLNKDADAMVNYELDNN